MDLTDDLIRAQVDRLAHSKSFEASEVHRHLLRYLADKTLLGDADRLKEYVIGLEAFGKPTTYDPKRDSIVRLQVGRLRQKIAAYYQTEVTDDSVLISLPKGAFRLEFKPLEQKSGEPVVPKWWTTRRLTEVLGIALLVMTIWAGVATTLLVRLSHETVGVTGRWTPDLESLWSPFLESKRPALLCLGTPLFVRFPAFGFFRDPKANDWQEIEKSDRITAVRKALGDKEIIPWYTFTGAGEASAAILVSNLLASRKRDIELTRSNILSWQQMVDDDVVFIGPPKFNQQLQAAALNQDITMEADGIRNLKPQQGEPTFLRDHIIAGKQSEGETYALISMLPGLSGIGRLLVIAGNASADTFAAAEWITQPWHAAELTRHLRTKSGDLPRYYEIVLKVEFKQGIPVQSAYLFHHVITAPAQQGGR